MEPVALATVFAKKHIALARVLAESLHRHHPDLPFFAALADEVDGYFDPEREPFQLLPLAELGIPGVHRLRFHYSQPELTYAVTPYLLGHLLDRGFRQAAYLKQESLVVGDLTPVLRLLDRNAIVLTPHLLRPLAGEDGMARELNILQSGVYNVGFLGVAATTTARAFLRWWQDRLFHHCRHDVPAGMHFEQRWLDLVPAFFDDVHIVRDPGFNVGHWNMPERDVTVGRDAVTAAGLSCRFVRFSGFDPEHSHAVTRYSRRLTMDTIGSAAELFDRYRTLLEDAGYHHTKAWPYAYDHFDNGVPVIDEVRKMYRGLGEAVTRFGDPLVTGSPGSFFAWLRQSGHARPSRPGSLRSRVLHRLKRAYWNRLERRGHIARCLAAIDRWFRK